MNRYCLRTNSLISLICILTILFSGIISGFDVSSVYASENSYISDVIFWDVTNGREERKYGFTPEDTGVYTVAVGDNARSIQIRVSASTFSDEDVYCQMTINDTASEPVKLTSDETASISTPISSELMGNAFRIGARKQGELVVGHYDSEKEEWGAEIRTYKFEFVRRMVLNSIAADGATISPNAISPNTDEYEISVPDNVEQLTLTPSLTIRSTVRDDDDPEGTKYSKTISYDVPEDAIVSDDGSAVFDIGKLAETDGRKYIDVAIGYSKEGSDIVGSSYRFYINSYEVIPETDHTPSVVIDGEKEITCEKDSVVDLKVTAEVEGEASFTYQWFKGATGSSVTTLIDGADQDIYNPETRYARTQYYRCRVTNTINDKKYIKYSNVFKVTTLCTYVTPPEVSRLTESQEVLQGGTVVFDINTDFYDWDGDSWNEPEYEWYINKNADTEGAELLELDLFSQFPGSHGSYKFDIPGTYYVYCIATATIGDKSASTTSDFIKITVNEPEGLDVFEGDGTEESPYLLSSLEDMDKIKAVLNAGYYFKDRYFKLISDLTIPSNWEPIGSLKEGAIDNGLGVNIRPFSGNLDGSGHTITVEEGGRPLFGYVRDASVKNLKIYGEQVNGYGLIDNYVVDYGTDGNSDTGVPATCNIENVTILSGSSILKSGFIGGVASGANTVNISNCTIQNGVTIGYDKTESNIGSFAGEFNGNITNSSSAAAVFGVDNIGGLVGRKGQSMGSCSFTNCEFTGSINATGDRAGGILGSGYYSSNHSAPNAPVVVINNCYAACDITGKNDVGGILGTEPEVEQCWGNGTGGVQNSFFYGEITATGSNVGGIIGYYNSLDKFQTIANNYYLDTCGTTKGIGKLNRIITAEEDSQNGREDDFDADRACSATSAAAFADGIVLDKLNSGEGSYVDWIQGEKYPEFEKKAVPVELNVSGYTEEYLIGDDFDTFGMDITVKYSDGTSKKVDPSEVEFRGFDSATVGQKTITATYGPISTTFEVSVVYDEPPEILVRLIIIGDTVHEGTSEVHTLKGGGLKKWLDKNIIINMNMSVYDLLAKGLDELGVEHKASYSTQYGSNYVSGIQVPGSDEYLEEFTNGSLSGWLYHVNGYYPDVGVSRYYPDNGDVIVFHYTDDYTQEAGLGSDGAGFGEDLEFYPPKDDPEDPAEEERKKKEHEAAMRKAEIKKAKAAKTTLKVKALKKHKAKIIWKKVTLSYAVDGKKYTDVVTGYKIYRATKKAGKYKLIKTVKKAGTLKYTDKKLKKGKQYYYKVRTYIKIDGKTYLGKWSMAKRIKVR